MMHFRLLTPALTLLESFMTEATCDIGLIGLAVMGENLALNIASRGFRIAVYNRTTSVTDAFIADAASRNMLLAVTHLKTLLLL
jgi:6-phosphogluconate dehydrogenase